ncbi:cyclic nucleotide-binding domain-containing protein [Siccationidurans ginsengisoli]|uniref:cyclic nucleotide-binding domain-containing protein n=1 Tax=Hymenobacter TaxID=89966 RepID=UPI001AACF5E8|nr:MULTISPECIES: cyclic nucleotide-binding domain-containing protein [unclassified Hymenobacter]MBO2033254.1 cyclic nucleotide-binding domain-containing protein [Hymenobacter sp. BT559]
MPSSLIEYLQLSKPIPAADRSLIDAAWTMRALAEGEPLVVAGQVCRELFFIEEGVVRIVVPQATGKEVTHFFLREGQFCTILLYHAAAGHRRHSGSLCRAGAGH